MLVLVVGGAGYIGSHTARCLYANGYDVRIYDNLSTGHSSLMPSFELRVGDLRDRAKLVDALSGVDAVMHFAAHAYVGESVENPRKYYDNNVQAGLVLLNAVIDEGIKYFIFSSTCAVYGEPTLIPIEENMHRTPVNPYGVSKLFMEHAIQSYGSAYSLRHAILRYFNAAGADESGMIGEIHDPETHIIPLALAAAMGNLPEFQVYGDDYPTPDGTCIRDYIHVNDLAEAHVRALQYISSKKKDLVLNLGTGSGHSIKEILTEVERVTGLHVPHHVTLRRRGDPPILVANPWLAFNLLEWKPRRDLSDIVATAYNWSRTGLINHVKQRSQLAGIL